MSQEIYINYPGVIFALLLETSFIFLFSYINIKYYKGKLKCIIIGIVGFICAVILEGITVSIISKISGNESFIFYILIMLFPGLFEETARYICLKYIFNKNTNKIISISYGIGHGGIESFLIGLSSLRLLFLKDTLIEQGLLKEDITFIYNLMSIVERFFTIIIHISLSVLIYKSLKDKNMFFYILAIILHDLIDLIAFFYQKEFIGNIFLIEMSIGLFSLFLSRYANNLYINMESEKIQENKEKNISLKDKKVEI